MGVESVAYRPVVWSCFGRAHPETEVMLEAMAVQAARRRGLRDHRLLLRRVRAAVGVALVRRSVRMVAACLPHLAEGEARLLLGAAREGDAPLGGREVVLVDGEADVAVDC